jgi:hypothetical protein
VRSVRAGWLQISRFWPLAGMADLQAPHRPRIKSLASSRVGDRHAWQPVLEQLIAATPGREAKGNACRYKSASRHIDAAANRRITWIRLVE